MSNSLQKSLVKPFDPSSCAAALLGPKQAIPAAARSSAIPATSGASGPDDETYRVDPTERHDLGTLGGIEHDPPRHRLAARISGRDEKRPEPLGLGDGERQGVFARSGAENQHVHARTELRSQKMRPIAHRADPFVKSRTGFGHRA